MNLFQQAGFDFTKSADTVEVFEYKMESIKSCMEALELHIQNQGGKIQSTAVFDPFKSSLASTADSMKIPV